jgi:H+/Cl- antiporter ClcA
VAYGSTTPSSAPTPGPAPGDGDPDDRDECNLVCEDDDETNDFAETTPTDALAVACGVGLLTGLGVGVFNIAEHHVHDLVFLTTTVYSPDRFQVEGARDVRPETWVQALGTVAAPTLAGCAATGLRFLAGGFDGEETPRWPKVFSSAVTDADGAAANAVNVDADATAQNGGSGVTDGSWMANAQVSTRPFLKAAAAVLTLGAGASLGPEGPSVEIGAAIARSLNEASVTTRYSALGGISSGGSALGASVNTTERLSTRAKSRIASRRLGLVAAGSAAGISAGFGAPIAGLFFAFESVLQPASVRKAGATGVDDAGGSTGFGVLTTESVILASVLAAVVSETLLGEQPAFVVPAFELKNLAELPLYLPLGLLCGATAVAFRGSSAVLGKGFAALERGIGGRGESFPGESSEAGESFAGSGFRVPREFHAPLGGFAFGIVASFFPEVTYQGFDNVNSMLGAEGSPFRTPYSPELLGTLVLVKLAATALCRQSGLVGGVYAPSLFMGAALGSAYGAALVPLALAGAPVAPPQAYALVGMAGVLAGICRVPLTAILLLFELTRDSRIIVPLMGTVGVASWVAGAAERQTNALSVQAQTSMTPTRAKGSSSYVAVEVPAGKAEGLLGGSAMLSFDDEDKETSPTPKGNESTRGNETSSSLVTFSAAADAKTLQSMRKASKNARVADAVRRDAPRVLGSASALEAATAATEAVRDGSHARCCVVVDADGTFLGVATATSLALALAQGLEVRATALEACDSNVPIVASSWTLAEAQVLMRRSDATLAAVVATITTSAKDDGPSGVYRNGAALGVLEAGAAVAERDAASLAAALRAREAAALRRAEGADVSAPR